MLVVPESSTLQKIHLHFPEQLPHVPLEMHLRESLFIAMYIKKHLSVFLTTKADRVGGGGGEEGSLRCLQFHSGLTIHGIIS